MFFNCLSSIITKLSSKFNYGKKAFKSEVENPGFL